MSTDWWNWSWPQCEKREALGLPDLVQCDDPCWRAETLGRCGDSAAICELEELARDQDWQVRCSALLALGRLNHGAPLALGLEDPFLYRFPWGEPGHRGPTFGLCWNAVSVYSQKGLLALTPGLESLPTVLSGLGIRSAQQTEYDSSPEPFPLFHHYSVPDWYVQGTLDWIVRVGDPALPFLVQELEKVDFQFTTTSETGPQSQINFQLIPHLGARHSLHGLCRWATTKIQE